jgi:redox-sensitive bicupin YhaK (pirin superfamily)
MIQIRKANERGHAERGWLDSWHTFSFADYHDEEFMGFSALRVINDDRIQGGAGFGMHPHRDMEIITYVIEGALEHKDSMGTNSIIRPGEVQRMTAGTGIRHSEFNHIQDKTTHLLQIWILPDKEGLKPGYEQKSFASELARDDLILVASKSGRDGSVSISQSVEMFAARSSGEGRKAIKVAGKRKLWVQAIRGEISVDGAKLFAGDGAGITDTAGLELSWSAGSELLLFDLP